MPRPVSHAAQQQILPREPFVALKSGIPLRDASPRLLRWPELLVYL